MSFDRDNFDNDYKDDDNEWWNQINTRSSSKSSVFQPSNNVRSKEALEYLKQQQKEFFAEENPEKFAKKWRTWLDDKTNQKLMTALGIGTEHSYLSGYESG